MGAFLATRSLLVLAGGMGGLVVLAVRTRREEANLLRHFGPAYRSYMERTGRYLPRLR